MSLSAKQYRQYKLIVLLSTGKPISKDHFFREVGCSEPTFVRDLKEIREDYQADIKFDKSLGKYQLVDAGAITTKQVRYMRDCLALYEQARSGNIPHSSVTLDKEAKRSVSLSLRLSVIRKIQAYANSHNINRSQVIEWLVEEKLGNGSKK